MLPCVCSVIDHRGRQNVVRTSVTHSAAPRVPLFCSYHILTSSVIYYWTDARQHGIYLLSKPWAIICDCFVHQHGRLIIWLKPLIFSATLMNNEWLLIVSLVVVFHFLDSVLHVVQAFSRLLQTGLRVSSGVWNFSYTLCCPVVPHALCISLPDRLCCTSAW